MKPVDLLLLSVAIGLTCFTAWTFCSAEAAPGSVDPAQAVTAAPEVPYRNPSFRSIVIHHSATHGGSAAAFERNHRARLGGLAYHFIIGNGSGAGDGGVETGYRWRDQVPGPHTKNQAMNLESVAVCLVGDLQTATPTRKQLAALLDLLEKICRECGIDPARISSHREVDSETLCPGRLPMDEIRKAIARRLESSATRVQSANP